MDITGLNKLLGNLDIYLLDQILKGRFTKEMKILEAGCGEGRNLRYFLNKGFQVFGVDQNPAAIQMTRILARTINQTYDIHSFQIASVEDMPFHHASIDVLISSAVLHFSHGNVHFHKMMDEMMRILKPGGLFFLRMATGFGGILSASTPRGDGIYQLPDGSERFVLTETILTETMGKYHLHHIEAPKSVLVLGQREMGVFVMQKSLMEK